MRLQKQRGAERRENISFTLSREKQIINVRRMRAQRPNHRSPVQILAARAMSRAELLTIAVFGATLIAFGVMFLLAIHFLSVEADESWILMSTFHAFGVSVPRTSAVAIPTVTSGGLHLLVHGLLSWLTRNILAHRLVSTCVAFGLLFLVFRLLKSFEAALSDALAGTALFAATPWFLLQAGLALAEVMATMVLLLGCLHWISEGQRSLKAAIVSGAIFGVACATRVNCLIALPALMIWPCTSGRNWAKVLPLAAAAVATAVGVFIACLGIYVIASRTGGVPELRHYAAVSTGVGGVKHGASEVLRYVVIANGFLPVAIIAAVCVAWTVLVRKEGWTPPQQLSGLLLLIALANWFAWVVASPIPHVRYLWPAIPFFSLVGIIALVRRLGLLESHRTRLSIHVAILAVCAYQLIADAMTLANGESVTLAYQASSSAPFDLPRPRFHVAADQRALAAHIAAQPADARFFALVEQAAYPLTLLSGRTIEPITALPRNGLRYIAISPAEFAVWQPNANFQLWLKQNADLVFSSGNYALFRVRQASPPAEPAMLPVGRNRLFPVTASLMLSGADQRLGARLLYASRAI